MYKFENKNTKHIGYGDDTKCTRERDRGKESQNKRKKERKKHSWTNRVYKAILLFSSNEPERGRRVGNGNHFLTLHPTPSPPKLAIPQQQPSHIFRKPQNQTNPNQIKPNQAKPRYPFKKKEKENGREKIKYPANARQKLSKP